MQEYYPAGRERCYACIQWDGVRFYDNPDKGIKVDINSLGLCRIKHAKVKGNQHCSQFFPLK